jgi:divalent metal cation (Fe/Co/Zn/Cd) transporter
MTPPFGYPLSRMTCHLKIAYQKQRIETTAAMMVGEIIAGAVFGSMAPLADGFHMATHAGALTIAAVAYLYRPASSPWSA